MSLKIVVRMRMPDTNSSAGVFVAYSSPPPQDMEVFPPLHYGSYMVLVPNDLPPADKSTPRLVTLRGRAQWLLGVLIDEMPLPQQLVGSITSEEEASEKRAVLEQYLAGHLDSEIQEFIASVELEEAGYRKWFYAKRELLKQYIELLENPRENGLPEEIPYPAKVVIRVPQKYTRACVLVGHNLAMVQAPPGWVIGFFSPGEDEGYIKLESDLESDKFVPVGKVFEEKNRGVEYLESIWHRVLSTPIPAKTLVAEMLRGYLVPEYLPVSLWDPNPFLSPAEPVDKTTRLFCISAGGGTLEAIKQKLYGFAEKTRVNGVLRSATLFCPFNQLLSEGGEIDKEKAEWMKEDITLFLYDFAPNCGMSVTVSLDVVVRASNDNWFHLSLLCSTPLFESIFQTKTVRGDRINGPTTS